MASIADQFLNAGRSGGEVSVENQVTGRSESIPVEFPPPAPATQTDTPHSTISAEVEFARNLSYNKISVRLFVSTPCAVGGESMALAKLTDMLDKHAVAYSEKAIERLRSWSQG